MRRGDLVIVVSSGDYGKPRPALIVQSDTFDTLPSVTVAPLTSDLGQEPGLRVFVPRSSSTGLRTDSRVMVDKVTTLPRHKVGARIGRLDDGALDAVDACLAAFLGLSSRR